ncbi:MAG TPA: beta-ketoacyl-[acyl-carrier-protein] synthase family protein [Verrucomicrobiae bacterium]|nr:beta-ketoacyl-[acyl-carrier-protein] synthase family protein [Verrucomicrobiae bacterium]
MKRVVVTGLGFITSIGNSRAQVLRSLQQCLTGVEVFPEFASGDIPIKLAGTVKNFQFPTAYFEDWSYPSEYRLTREQLRPMAPNSLYAFCAMQQAIAEAQLGPELVSNPRTGLMCASGGSMWLAYENYHTMLTRGVARCQPMGIINAIPGSLYINLVSCFKIKGGSLGFSSACSSSSHALGAACDLIRLGRQDTVFVVGAEDCNKFSILPFAGIRALSLQTDPAKSPCAFDSSRDGFVGTGGAAVLVVEELEHARNRGAVIEAEVLGWGQSSDGYNVIAPDPTGDGLKRAMEEALCDAQLQPNEIDYINAHATSTTAGDVSECRAIQSLFHKGKLPHVSSTKSLTGHGLSLAGAMEAAFCVLALQERFTPVSAHVTQLDPECATVPIVTKPVSDAPRIALSNSSGFGGTNVSIALRRWENGESS